MKPEEYIIELIQTQKIRLNQLKALYKINDNPDQDTLDELELAERALGVMKRVYPEHFI